jgi:hypothetical protein
VASREAEPRDRGVVRERETFGWERAADDWFDLRAETDRRFAEAPCRELLDVIE